MQTKIVTALMPITVTVPVSVIVHSQRPATSKTEPLQTIIGPVSAKTAPQPKLRSVNDKAESLLKNAKNVQKHRKSLLKPVTPPQSKRSLLKPVIAPLSKKSLLKPVITPLNKKSLLKPIRIPPDKANANPVITSQNKKSLLKPIRISPDKANVNPMITSQNKKSLLKPVIVPQERDTANIGRKQPDVIESSNNGSIDNFESIPKCVVRTVRPAKSLLKPLVPQNPLSRASLEEHAYVMKDRGTPEDTLANTTRKVYAHDITVDDFKTTETAKKSLAILKNVLKRSKEKLHSRHRRMSSTAGKVTQLKKLLIDLKSRNLVTEEAYSQLDRAANSTLTIIRNHFQTDLTA